MRRRFNSDKFNAYDYLSFVALEDSTSFTFNISDGYNNGFIRPILYNIDGIKWKTYNGEEITINNGQVLSVKTGGYKWDQVDNPKGCVKCSSPFEVFGNILSVSTIDTERYSGLFRNCTSLVNASNLKLPVTTLTIGCYEDMFKGCTSLTMAPVLPATILTSGCYRNMFRGCSKLNYIKMLATDISAANCLGNWVSGVSSTGTFVKHPEATWDVRGVNGVPEGWTIKFDGEEESGGKIITFTMTDYFGMYPTTEYEAEEGMTWIDFCESKYNIDNWKVVYDEGQEDYLILSQYDEYVSYEGSYVRGNEIIIPNGTYDWW